jgi:hypothetical protein
MHACYWPLPLLHPAPRTPQPTPRAVGAVSTCCPPPLQLLPPEQATACVPQAANLPRRQAAGNNSAQDGHTPGERQHTRTQERPNKNTQPP